MSKATQEFVSEHTKMNDAGDVRNMTQASYLTYMQDQHQISAEVLKSVAHADRSLISGATTVAMLDLGNRITAAKQAGDDPSELVSSVHISRPSGQLSTDVRAERTSTNPSNGEKSTKHGVVTVKARLKTMIDPAAAEEAKTYITKLMA